MSRQEICTCTCICCLPSSLSAGRRSAVHLSTAQLTAAAAVGGDGVDNLTCRAQLHHPESSSSLDVQLSALISPLLATAAAALKRTGFCFHSSDLLSTLSYPLLSCSDWTCCNCCSIAAALNDRLLRWCQGIPRRPLSSCLDLSSAQFPDCPPPASQSSRLPNLASPSLPVHYASPACRTVRRLVSALSHILPRLPSSAASSFA